MTEPSITLPRNSRLWKGHTLVAAKRLDGVGGIEFPWINSPDPRVDHQLLGWHERKTQFIMVAANKFSFVKGELYSLRRSVFMRKRSMVVVVGDRWNQGAVLAAKTITAEFLRALWGKAAIGLPGVASFLRLSGIKGVKPVSDKFSAMREFKYALVIENSLQIRTEKLFDAIEAGAIPVYVGPRLEDGIPESLYVHAGPSVEEIGAAMDNISELVDFESWSIQRRQWLSSECYALGADERLVNLLKRLRDRNQGENPA